MYSSKCYQGNVYVFWFSLVTSVQELLSLLWFWEGHKTTTDSTPFPDIQKLCYFCHTSKVLAKINFGVTYEFQEFQVITTVKTSFNYHAQTSESDLERLNCLSQWAICTFQCNRNYVTMNWTLCYILHYSLPPQKAPPATWFSRNWLWAHHTTCAASEHWSSQHTATDWRGLAWSCCDLQVLLGQSTGAAHPLGITCPFAKPQSSLEQSLLMLRAEMAPYWAPTAVLPRHSRRAWFWSGAEQLVRN